MNVTQAAKLYRQAVQEFENKVGSQSYTPQETQNSPFLGMVQDVAHNAVDSVANAEKISLQATAGKADLSEVAIAISHAESTLQTVVTVRDRMITAYQEIMRMPM